jgi:mercuric ion transport protein
MTESDEGISAMAGEGEAKRQGIATGGGIIGALAAATCCIAPFLLISAGVGGAWMGNLTTLAPYQPIFIVVTLGFLGYGYYLVYWKLRKAYAEDAACAQPLPNRVVRISLWAATALVAQAIAFPYIA